MEDEQTNILYCRRGTKSFTIDNADTGSDDGA